MEQGNERIGNLVIGKNRGVDAYAHELQECAAMFLGSAAVAAGWAPRIEAMLAARQTVKVEITLSPKPSFCVSGEDGVLFEISTVLPRLNA
jgi:hypothetical protein